jgi:cytochrome P450 family 9
MRTTLSPIFTSAKMKMFYGLLSKQANDFVDFYEQKAKIGGNLVYDVLDVFTRYTADGISTAVLGFEADCVRNKDSQIFKTVQKLLHDFIGTIGSIKFLFAFTMPKLYALLGIQCMSEEIYNFFHRVVIDVMNERDRTKTSRSDVIQLLLEAKKGQLKHNDSEIDDKELANFSANIEYDLGSKTKNASQFSDNDWIAQGFIFFAAG